MGEVCVAIKDGGVVRTAHVHKNMLNAFQDMHWFAPQMAPDHPLNALFEGPQPPLEAHEYGLVVIDRDTKWVGSSQGFLSMGAINLFTSRKMLDAVQHLDLKAELKRFDRALWPQLFAHEGVRGKLLWQAYQAGATQRVRAARSSDQSASWESLESLGLDTLPEAVEWLHDRRDALAGGKLMGASATFEFAPVGWEVVDYGSGDEAIQALEAALVERGLKGSE